jgi:hypothetical protein
MKREALILVMASLAAWAPAMTGHALGESSDEVSPYSKDGMVYE